MVTTLLYIYTESALHAGVGSNVSVIDLPIQRERTTHYPHIYGSGIKGALRSQSTLDKTNCNIIFGPDPDSANDNNKKIVAHAGAISVGEAKLVLFPVRSLTGIFAYVTCPFILARLARDLCFAGIDEDLPPVITELQDETTCMVAPVARQNGGVARSGSVVLEEYTFNAKTDEERMPHLANWLNQHAMPDGNEYSYWREKLPQRLVVIPDDAFRDFVMYSTQIVTRIRIQKDTKTVKDGALWTQESLPPDALLVSTVIANEIKFEREVEKETIKVQKSEQDIAALLVDYLPTRIQIGGDETTGHGMVALKWH